MSGTRLFSVKLNDGYFMPVLGLGTSAPHEVTVMALETQRGGQGPDPN